MPPAETFYGTPVVNGLAYGPVAWVSRFEIPDIPATKIPLDQRESEAGRYLKAAKNVFERLLARSQETIGTASDILAAQAEFYRDPEFKNMVLQAIKGEPQLEQVTKEQCENAAQAILTAADSGDARARARRALGIDR